VHGLLPIALACAASAVLAAGTCPLKVSRAPCRIWVLSANYEQKVVFNIYRVVSDNWIESSREGMRNIQGSLRIQEWKTEGHAMITGVAGVITNRFHTMPPPRDEKLVSFTEECHTPLLPRLLWMIENARRVMQYPMTVIDWMSDAVSNNWSEYVRIIQLRNENASIAWISPHAASWFEFTSWCKEEQDQQLSAPQPTVKELKLAVSAAVPSHKIERIPGMREVSKKTHLLSS
jgi:hypothetical protein